MDIKRRICDIRNWKNIYFSTYPPPALIHLSHRFTSMSKHGSFWLLSQPLPELRFKLFVVSETTDMFLDPDMNHFTWQTIPTVNRKHFFINILCIESFCPQIRATDRCFSALKHGRHFDYRNPPLNMRIRVCYLDCHEAGLCCYLLIHTEILLRPLRLFYFHLRPIYWFFLVHNDIWSLKQLCYVW
jgi:hypothetical protein